MPGLPPRLTRTALLASGDGTGHGGQSLRLKALHSALSRSGSSAIHAIGCNRWGTCQSACQASGRPTMNDLSVSWCGNVVWYYDLARCADRAAALHEEFRRTGVTTVICSGLESHGYVREFAAVGMPVVFDMHNVELALHRAMHEDAPADSIFAQRFTDLHLRLLEPAERSAVVLADEVWTCSAVDRQLTADLYSEVPLQKIRVVPNVVDAVAPPRRPGEAERVCFIGRLDYFPNVQAAEFLAGAVAPLLTARGYTLPVVIAGGGGADAFREPPPAPNVELISDPPTVSDLIRDSIVAVPLRIGGGTRFKILEAFALGAPVVATTKAIEGIDGAVAGEHYLAAEDAVEFADAIGTLVDNPAARLRLADAGWRLVSEGYSVDALARALASWATVS